MTDGAMLARASSGAGFIAALDQSGGSTPKALKGYGIGKAPGAPTRRCSSLIHGMRSRIITSPAFTATR